MNSWHQALTEVQHHTVGEGEPTCLNNSPLVNARLEQYPLPVAGACSKPVLTPGLECLSAANAQLKPSVLVLSLSARTRLR